jgi:hypothetical protein
VLLGKWRNACLYAVMSGKKIALYSVLLGAFCTTLLPPLQPNQGCLTANQLHLPQTLKCLDIDLHGPYTSSWRILAHKDKFCFSKIQNGYKCAWQTFWILLKLVTAIPRSFDGLGTRALTKVENRRKSKHSLYLSFIYFLYCYHKITTNCLQYNHKNNIVWTVWLF